MPARDASTAIADSVSFNAGQSESAIVEKYHTPAVCVELKSLDGNTDDTITVAIEGDLGTYDVASETLSEAGSFVVDVPQCNAVQVTSSNGTTINAEARNNPR